MTFKGYFNAFISLLTQKKLDVRDEERTGG